MYGFCDGLGCFSYLNMDKFSSTRLDRARPGSVMRRHHPGEALRGRHGVVAPAVAPDAGCLGQAETVMPWVPHGATVSHEDWGILRKK